MARWTAGPAARIEARLGRAAARITAGDRTTRTRMRCDAGDHAHGMGEAATERAQRDAHAIEHRRSRTAGGKADLATDEASVAAELTRHARDLAAREVVVPGNAVL